MSNLVEDKKSSDTTLTRRKVESLQPRVRKTDHDEDYELDLFCYVKCKNTDDNLMKKCRGLVFHRDELVLQTFPYEEEVSENDANTINEKLTNFSNFTFYESYEGALIRVFYFQDKWFIATHRKLNAFKSKWASQTSFGDSFVEALTELDNRSNTYLSRVLSGSPDEKEDTETDPLKRFLNRLDVNKQYVFLLLNNSENRIVCQAPHHSTVFHVGTFSSPTTSSSSSSSPTSGGGGEETKGNGGDRTFSLTEDVGVPHPKKLNFRNVDELRKWVAGCNYKHLQGVICFGEGGDHFKILNGEYEELFQARGNEPSIKFRYLQVRMNKYHSDMLRYLYPEHIKIFEQYENNLYDIAKNVHTAYVNRFIKKMYVTVPPEEYLIMKACHSWHREDKNKNKISLEKVIDVINEQSATVLNKMIRRYHAETLKKQEQHAATTYMLDESAVRNHSPLLLSQKNRTEPQTLEL